ncbi:hypothetical protein [Roseomonas rosulenta]|uniref:hypothetical protein n=1 Tax=Roseomonas rosulenta TaxID=2748667 RepID=UPI0018DFCF6F|nr:hypothetical protein [Roseomonas rosulenta]
MDTRESSEIVEFRHPFILRAGNGPQPAGRYIVHLEEETLDGLSFQAWRCKTMTISREGGGGVRQALPLTPTELAALRAADGQAAS